MTKMLQRTLVLLLSLAMLLAAGCGAPAAAPQDAGAPGGSPAPAGGTSPTAAAPTTGGILRVAMTATVTTWDPSAAFSTEVSYLSNFYEPLLWANPPGSDEPFTPALATGYQVSDDGLTWTFDLRQGVTFHDGTPFTAEAVKYSIERTKELKKGASFIWWPVEEIAVVGDYQVRFQLKVAVPLDRIVSSGNGAWIISPATRDQPEQWWEQGNVVGTGPWVLDSYRPGEEVVLARFDDYWGGWQANQYDKVVVKMVPEALTQRQMLEAGEVDIAGVVPVESLPTLEQKADLQVHRFQSYTNFLAFFNTKRRPLDNAAVRQALSYAVPYQDIITVATGGLGTQARGPVPTGLWPWDESLPQYTYDPDRARRMLAAAGYPDGLDLTLTYTAENPASERFSPLIKEGFAAAGVNLTVQPMLWNQHWALAKEDPATAQDIFVLMWWPTYSDGYDNLSSMFTIESSPAWNLAYWYNETYDALLEEAYSLSGTQVAESQRKYIELQTLLINEAPAIFLYDAMDVLVMSAAVQGFRPNASYPKVIFFYDLHR